MIRKLKIGIIIIACLFFLIEETFGQTNKNQLVLFTDRDYCISGDTVWFKVFLNNTPVNAGDVIRVQLDKNGEHYINGVAKKASNSVAEGFIPVPDSLSTGVYLVSAFLNANRNAPELMLQTNTLLVYNRFDEVVSEIYEPGQDSKIKLEDFSSQIKIGVKKQEYSSREKVHLELSSENKNIDFAVIRAELLDPLSEVIGGKYYFEYESVDNALPDFPEKNGILVSGKVTDSEMNGQAGILTLLSITGEPSYFDYYLTGEKGDFHFFLKEAVGTTNAVIQVVTKAEKEYLIFDEINRLKQKEPLKCSVKTLTLEQSKFISDLINGSFFSRIFNPAPLHTQVSFEMPIPYNLPFYGEPTRRIKPEEFIELPNFKEISRELLWGVQYRERKGEITFRMLNQTRGTFFADEPLRLINGIPVFKNTYFSNLNSTDINYIDVVQKERVFGDLMFKGVLEVNLIDRSNAWMTRQKNIVQLQINALQPHKKTNRNLVVNTDKNIPDLRKTFLWEKLNTDSMQNFEFQLSDVKGKVKISVEGITTGNKIFSASKIIEVK